MGADRPVVRVADLESFAGQEVCLRGWAWNRRGSGKVRFLQLRDGSGFVQVVAGEQDTDAESFERMRHLEQEAAVEVVGRVVRTEGKPVEVVACSVVQLGGSGGYPITPKEHGTEFLMERRHLWLRSPRQQAILRVRHRIASSIRGYFDDLGFTLVDAPIFTANECEGSSTLFATDYFGEKAYLSQSGQLYMEAAAAAVGKAYCFGPTFRAENSNTRRHLTEFWMVEPEVAFMDLAGDMELAEGLVHRILAEVLEHCRPELERLERDTAPLEAALRPFARLSYSDAVEILREAGEEFTWGEDFGGGHETIIASRYDRPVIVHRYPAACKAFYMRRDSDDDRLSLSMDVLAPEGYGEVIGGGERATDLAVLERTLAEHGIAPEPFDWYLDLRKYGTFPHAGFGLGLERTVAWVCGLPHVRETIPFPRMPGRLRP
ncbi:MAG TPA: asparagine--tRNA ligase [Kiritimatiellia bacterium]|nr:asparagine--tRNA ligase [Kiritimatiellia bacterium]